MARLYALKMVVNIIHLCVVTENVLAEIIIKIA